MVGRGVRERVGIAAVQGGRVAHGRHVVQLRLAVDDGVNLPGPTVRDAAEGVGGLAVDDEASGIGVQVGPHGRTRDPGEIAHDRVIGHEVAGRDDVHMV